MKNILVLGIGNMLLGDEGFGPQAAAWLADNFDWPDNVQVVDGATRGLMLMSELLECDVAIIMDIILAGGEKGAFYRLGSEDLDKSWTGKYSMHQTSLQDILASCELIDHRPEVIVLAMEPYEYQILRPQLTAEAKSRLPEFCSHVLKELENLGVKIKPLGVRRSE